MPCFGLLAAVASFPQRSWWLFGLSLVALSLLTLSAAQLEPLVITSVSGCSGQVGPVTTACTGQEVLTVAGTGFAQYGSALLVSVANFSCPLSGPSEPTRLFCSLPRLVRGLPVDEPALVSVIAPNSPTLATSPSSPYVVFSGVAPFSVAGVSSCGASGCNVASAVVTLTGSGFSSVPASSWACLWSRSDSGARDPSGVGYEVWPSSPSTRTPYRPFVVLNDTMALWFLNSTQSASSAKLSASGNLTFLVMNGDTLPSPANPLTVAFQPTVNNSAPAPLPVPVLPMLLTSITGCPVRSGGASGSCTSADTQLTLSGSGFRTLGLIVSAGRQWCPIVRAITNTTIVCSLRNQESSPSNTPVPITVIDLLGQQQSNALATVVFSLVAPNIASLSGCGGAQAALECDPTVDALTISGSGFSSPLSLNFLSAELNSLVTTIPLTRAQLTDGSVVVQRLATLPSYALAGMSAYESAPFGVWLTQGFVQSNVALMSLRAGALNVTGISGCQSGSGPLQVRSCFAQDVLTLFGDNLYSPVSIEIAGGQCVVSSLQDDNLSCQLQMGHDYATNAPYDVIVTSGSLDRNITLPAAISFTSAPVILSLTSQFCSNGPDVSSVSLVQTGRTVLRCAPGDVLTLLGSRFALSAFLEVQLLSAGNSPALCSNATVLSDSEVTCVLPEFVDTWNTLPSTRLQLVADDSQSSNVVNAVLYRSSWQPAVSAIDGCGEQVAATAGRTVVNCAFGDTITVFGAAFSAPLSVQLWDGELAELYMCVGAVILSANKLTCQLPVLVDETTLVQLLIQVRSTVRGSLIGSNWMAGVQYGPLPQSANGCSEPSDHRQYVVALLVLLASLAVVVVVLFVTGLRLRNMHKQSTLSSRTDSTGSERESDIQQLELSPRSNERSAVSAMVDEYKPAASLVRSWATRDGWSRSSDHMES